MRKAAPLVLPVAFLLVLMLTAAAHAADGATSEWVHPGPEGKLVYKTTPAGDRIMDFSYAGYKGGGIAIPDVPAKQTVKPTGGADDTAAIQAAIDAVAGQPLDENGFRGAVELAAGTFNCATTINIGASGVVLRGSGSASGGGNENRTTIMMTGRPHLAIAVRRPGAGRGNNADAATTQDADVTKTTIADPYVPSGSISFTVADAHGFAVGDTILIRRPVTEAWVKFMHMDDMTRDGKPQTWIRTGSVTTTERRIKAIDGNRVTLDVPLSDSFDSKHLNPPGTAVVKIAEPDRLTQVGVEHLHIESPPQPFNHTQPHHQALRINGEDCWARDVAIDETMNSVGVSGRRITLQRVTVTRKAKHQGSSKPAEFAPNGSEVLMDRCEVTGDNVWYVATGAGVAGPMVILNCTFHGDGHAESHQRWSTGILYDNVRAPGGGIELRNRGSMGSGHGWSMGWGVVWNCVAEEFLIQDPPGAMNWLIGSSGEVRAAARPFGNGPNLPGGTVDSPNAPVTPRSLYLAQLQERLGPDALRKIGYESATDLPAPEAAK